jgi:hypothetical protein
LIHWCHCPSRDIEAPITTKQQPTAQSAVLS